MNNFDWWTLVLVPLAVSFAYTYLQRWIDKYGRSPVYFISKRRIRYDVISAASTLARIADDTFTGHAIKQLIPIVVSIVCSATSFIVVLLAIYTDKDGTWTAVGYKLLLFFSGLAAFWLASAFMRQADKDHAVFRDPAGTTELLIKRVDKIIPGEMDKQIEIMRRLSTAIELARSEKLEAMLNYQSTRAVENLLNQVRETINLVGRDGQGSSERGADED